MSKFKTQYICQNCASVFPKWMGKCSSCNQWNSLIEEVVMQGKDTEQQLKRSEALFGTAINSTSIPIMEVQSIAEQRILSADEELNRVLGGGIVQGSIILLGGEPGIGKSTLLLQLALQLKNAKVLYISGEESATQIKMRAERIGIENTMCYLLTETNIVAIFKHLKAVQPKLCIIDSIQTLVSGALESTAGSVSQIRECAAEMQRYAKESNIPVFLIGHITKDGNIAGPKVLEHMVDTVLQFEGDMHHAYRLLRTKKNRFGSTSELGIYEMLQNGLRQVSNPSELFISENLRQLSGIAIAATIEGQRPLLIETQALVSSSAYGTPQRSATGYDNKRLNMLLAVLEKRCGFKFGDKDVFVNIAGGIKVEDPAIDLAVICALLSSFEDVCIPKGVCFAGEVGLSGEVRSVTRLEQRISEAEKLGFKKIYLYTGGKAPLQNPTNTLICNVDTVEAIYKALFA